MKPNSYSQSITISSSMCDTRFQASISGLLDAFQDVQTTHTQLMGVDAPTLKEKDNAFWVLSKYQLHIDSLPSWRQSVTVTTWPSPPSMAKAERQLFIEDENGRPLVQAKAEWCALDCDTRKIKRLSSLKCYPFDMPHKSEKAWEHGFMPITQKPQESDFVYTQTVKYSLLDFNGHVNNVKYVSLITDCFTAKQWEALNVTDFEIIYFNESREGDQINLFVSYEDNKITVFGSLTCGKEIFKAVIVTK